MHDVANTFEVVEVVWHDQPTGMVGANPGLFEVADGGMLFIAEIGEMPGPLQAKLLRVLEDGSMRRIGSLKEMWVDVRLLAVTNRNMAEEVKIP